MIVLYTDFGFQGPYLGQVEARLLHYAPSMSVITLMADAPMFRPKAAGYLLASLVDEFPSGTVFVCVVDPQVGSKARLPVWLVADGRHYVGPGNGLLQVVAQRAGAAQLQAIEWRPQSLSDTFHGRDLFAPVAGMIAAGQPFDAQPIDLDSPWPEDLYEIIYVDGFGNAITGIRKVNLSEQATLTVNGRTLGFCRTYAEAELGEAFWYYGSSDLVEIGLNKGHAASSLGLELGTSIQ